MIPSRRAMIGGLGAALSVPAAARAVPERQITPLVMNGAWRQGGYAFGRTTPGALVLVDGKKILYAGPKKEYGPDYIAETVEDLGALLLSD